VSEQGDFSLLVIAGGQSRRMGQDKALLRVPNSGLPLLVHIVERLRGLNWREVVVVANNPETIRIAGDIATRTLRDKYPNAGPLGGLATGLAACAGWAAAVACDMPFVNANVFHSLAKIAKNEDGHDAVIPYLDGHAEVMHAIYHHRCAAVFSECVEANVFAVRRCLEKIRVRWVHAAEILPIDPALESVVSVNTPEEWANACAKLRATSPSA
jgi:molybdopterin-guanine dinucleotide biosynthesis protein A